MPAGLIRPIAPSATVNALFILSAPEQSSTVTAALLAARTVAISEGGGGNALEDALRYMSDMTRTRPALVISTSEAGRPSVTPSDQLSAPSMSLDQGNHESLGPAALTTAAENDPFSALSQNSTGTPSFADEQEFNALKDFPVDPRNLARVVEPLSHALQSQDPVKGVKAPLDKHLSPPRQGTEADMAGSWTSLTTSGSRALTMYATLRNKHAKS